MRNSLAYKLLFGIVIPFHVGVAGQDDLGRPAEHLSRRTSGPVPITVRVFNFSTAPEGVLKLAVTEADRLFMPLRLPFDWIDCSRAATLECRLEGKVDVIVRVLPAALPRADKNALGATSHTENGSISAVFYDRILSVRTDGIFPAQILGRVMAHEIVHALLPTLEHRKRGLMRSQLTSGDFRIACGECTLLPGDLVEMIRREVRRRSGLADIADGPDPNILEAEMLGAVTNRPDDHGVRKGIQNRFEPSESGDERDAVATVTAPHHGSLRIEVVPARSEMRLFLLFEDSLDVVEFQLVFAANALDVLVGRQSLVPVVKKVGAAEIKFA